MHSPAVIYLESSNAKDVAFIRIKFPGYKSILYEIPAFKVLNHSVSELEGMALASKLEDTGIETAIATKHQPNS